jgi:hypothetical protein
MEDGNASVNAAGKNAPASLLFVSPAFMQWNTGLCPTQINLNQTNHLFYKLLDRPTICRDYLRE